MVFLHIIEKKGKFNKYKFVEIFYQIFVPF
jgi:hypothetical protein